MAGLLTVWLIIATVAIAVLNRSVYRFKKEIIMAYLDPVTTGIATLTAAVNKLIADVQTVNTELQAALAAEDPAAVAAAAASLDALTAAVTTEDNIINPPAAPTL